MKIFKGKTNGEYEIILEEEFLKYTIYDSGFKKSGSFNYGDFYFKKNKTSLLFRGDRYYLDLYLNGKSQKELSFPQFNNEEELNEILKYSNNRRSYYKKINKIRNDEKEIEKELKKKKEQDIKLRREQIEKKREEIKNKSLLKKKLSVLEELDKDNNGTIDIVENNNEFNELLKKHQKIIIKKSKDFNQNFTHHFIKVGNYLRDKRNNLQLIFNCIKGVENKEDLNEYVGILKNDIHSYNLLLINSFNLVVSLIEDDQLVFYDIYEKFDKLKIFNSNWENDMSVKLSQLEDGLSEVKKGVDELNSNIQNLMYEIREMGDKIVSSIDDLTYITEESTKIIDNRLMEIHSGIKFNNLLTLVQTYQMYKVNKNTKSLRE